MERRNIARGGRGKEGREGERKGGGRGEKERTRDVTRIEGRER